jgi:5'-nucleotidase
VDVLISGINDGFNAGMAVHYSGTVGAATEASLNRVRAMAVSTHHRASRATYAYTASLAIAAAEGYLALSVPHATVLNVNVPLREPDQMLPPVLAPLSIANFKDSYIRRESPRAGTYYWMSNDYSMEPPEAGSDLYWLDQGHVTVTFMGNPCEHGTEHTAFVNGLVSAASV